MRILRKKVQAVEEGQVAYEAGQSSETNPYSKKTEKTNAASKRQRWFDGYYGARTDEFIDKLESSNGEVDEEKKA